MNPPGSVRVGEHLYRLVVDQGRADDADVTYGATFTARTEVVINPQQVPSMLRDTVLHELLHAVCDDVGLTAYQNAPEGAALSHEVEEMVVRSLAGGVLALLRRNPRLVAFLTEK